MNSNVVLEYGQKNCQAVGSLLYHSRLRRQVFFSYGHGRPKRPRRTPKWGGAGPSHGPKMGRAGPNPQKGQSRPKSQKGAGQV